MVVGGPGVAAPRGGPAPELALGPGGDGVTCGARPVLPLMGQHGLPGGVARGVQPRVDVVPGGARDEAGGIGAEPEFRPFRGGEADALQPDPLEGGVPAGGDQDLVRRHRGAALQLEGEGVVVILADTVRAGVEVQIHAVRAQPRRDQRGGLLREGSQQAAAGHQGHRSAEPGERLGEFGTGHAAAQDCQPARDLAGGRRLPRGPVIHLGQALDGRHGGRGPGGHHNGVPCREHVAVAIQLPRLQPSGCP